jgi:hypothetical protein
MILCHLITSFIVHDDPAAGVRRESALTLGWAWDFAPDCLSEKSTNGPLGKLLLPVAGSFFYRVIRRKMDELNGKSTDNFSVAGVAEGLDLHRVEPSIINITTVEHTIPTALLATISILTRLLTGGPQLICLLAGLLRFLFLFRFKFARRFVTLEFPLHVCFVFELFFVFLLFLGF